MDHGNLEHLHAVSGEFSHASRNTVEGETLSGDRVISRARRANQATGGKYAVDRSTYLRGARGREMIPRLEARMKERMVSRSSVCGKWASMCATASLTFMPWKYRAS